MNYPLLSDYIEAIKAAEDNFEQLKHLRPVLDEEGNPVMTGGNFAEVFKMRDEQTGKLHAVKCFLREQEGRAEAFSGCTGLTSIMIPGSVQDISEYVFECCDGLTNIIVDGNNDIYDSRNNCNAIIDSRNNTLIQGCRSTIIPENIAVIGYGAFSRCRFLTSIIIPKGIREIKSYAFSNCSGLKTIDIPYGVNEIGESVFSGCSQLESISLPNSIIKIGSFAFCGCDLREITLPNSISEIGEDIFEECYSLDKIIIPQGVIGNFTHNSPLYGHLIVN